MPGCCRCRRRGDAHENCSVAFRRARCRLRLPSPATRRNSRSTRPGQNRCRTTGSWVRPQASRSMRRTISGSSSARARSPTMKRRRRSIRRARKCCVPAPPVLEFDPDGNLLQGLGRTGTRLRLVRKRARHQHRLQRIRLGRRQRQQRRPGAEIHPGRKVRAADRQARTDRRAAPTPPGSAGRPTRKSTRDQRGLHRRRLRQSPRHRVRCRYRRLQAPLGRLRQAAER